MRPFLQFILMLALALLAAAILTYPAWQLVMSFDVQPVHRVMHRLAQVFALVGTVVLLRRFGASNRQALGYTLPRPRFLKQMAWGFLIGALLMVPLVSSLYLLDIRDTRAGWDAARILDAIGAALLTGAVVALIEETFFRGALFESIRRTSGAVAAIALTSVLYASLHFIGGRLRIAPEQVSWDSGFAVLAKLFEKYAQPLALVDSFLALLAVGMLLAVVRARTGAIAACIGLHASWVTVIQSLRSLSERNPASEYDWLVGSYDGVIGWLALGWIALALVAYEIYSRRTAARIVPGA